MVHIFRQLLLEGEEEEEETPEATSCDLPTALAFRRLAKRHNVPPVVAKFDRLIEQ